MIQMHTKDDIFTLPRVCDAVCVTTNGIIKQNGRAVMGAGIAKQADDLYDLAGILGERLSESGNHTYLLKENPFYIISVPTKNHFKDPSSMNLIIQSCKELVDIADATGFEKCYLPPLGCGLGGLKWNDVYNSIKDILDNRFIAVLR